MAKIIVFEGPDGTGKSTQAKLLAKKLNCKYYNSPFYNEYDGGYSHRLIKELLQSHLAIQEPYTFQKLYANNRKMWINETYPYLLRYSDFVIIDRFNLSTYLYSKLLGINDHKFLAEVVKTDIYIDLQFILYNSEEKPFKKPEDSFEKERYLEICDRYNRYINWLSNKTSTDDEKILEFLPQYNCIINANQSIEKVHEDICNELRIRKYL